MVTSSDTTSTGTATQSRSTRQSEIRFTRANLNSPEGSYLTGPSFREQRRQLDPRDDALVVNICTSTTLITKLMPVMVQTFDMYRVQALWGVIDFDARAEVVADRGRALILSAPNLAEQVRDRSERDPVFKLHAKTITQGNPVRPLKKVGSGRRSSSELGEQVNGEIIDDFVGELVAALMPSQVNDPLRRIGEAYGLGPADAKIFVNIYSGLAGTSGSVLSLVLMAKLRKAFANKVNAYITFISFGPVAFTPAYLAQNGQPAFDHASAHLLEQWAITNHHAPLHGYEGDLFDAHYALDLDYTLDADGRLVPPSVAQLEAWQERSGALCASLGLLQTRGAVSADAHNYYTNRPEDAEGRISVLAGSAVALDRDALRRGVVVQAAKLGLEGLARYQEREDPTPGQSVADGREFAQNLPTGDGVGLHRRVASNPTATAPVRFNFTRAELARNRTEQKRLLPTVQQELRDPWRRVTDPQEILSGNAVSAYWETWYQVMRARQAWQAENIPDRYRLQGIAASMMDRLAEETALRDQAKAALDQAGAQVQIVSRDLDGMLMPWDDLTEHLRRAEGALNTLSSCWFAYQQCAESCDLLTNLIRGVESVTERAIIAAKVAALALPLVEARLDAEAQSEVNLHGLATVINDRSLLEAVVGPVALDPNVFAALPDGATAMAAAVDTVADGAMASAAAIQSVEDALDAKARHYFPAYTDDQIKNVVMSYLQELLVQPTLDEVQASNAGFDADAQVNRYLVSNQGGVPEFEGDCQQVLLNGTSVAPNLLFLHLVRACHGASFRAYPWLNKGLVAQQTPYPFIIPIDPSSLKSVF